MIDRGSPPAFPNTARHRRADWISCQIQGGESGSASGSTLNALSAAATALAITPPTEMIPPSSAPFGTERIDRRGMRAHHPRLDARKVARGGNEIIGEGAGEQLSLIVVHKMLEERTAQALNHRTNDLAVQRQWIDDLAQSATAT